MAFLTPKSNRLVSSNGMSNVGGGGGGGYPQIHHPNQVPASNFISHIVSSNSNSSSTNSSNSPETMLFNGGSSSASSSSNLPPACNTRYNSQQQLYNAAAAAAAYNPYSTLNVKSMPCYANLLGQHQMTSSSSSLIPPAAHNMQQQFKIAFEKLAFFEFLHELVAPFRLVGAHPNQRPFYHTFQFSLNQEQVNELINTRSFRDDRYEFGKQIHLRFGFCERTEQKDVLPANLTVNVNGKPASLPTPKPTSKPHADIIRPGRSIDISACIKLAPNIQNRV